MAFLQKLFRRPKRPASAQAEDAPCPHVTLAPKWDSVEDMGKEDRATGYTCSACRQSFSAEEGRALLSSEGERLTGLLSTTEDQGRDDEGVTRTPGDDD